MATETTTTTTTEDEEKKKKEEEEKKKKEEEEEEKKKKKEEEEKKKKEYDLKFEEYKRNREYEELIRERDEKEAKNVSSLGGLFVFVVLIMWLWVIAGLLGFLTSLVCFGFNGSISDKFLGLIIVLLIGPFYWLYFIYNSNYCFR
jgi:Flp pilus assembly protein TadB